MLPANDRTHEFFWRHAARWLASPAPDRVTITAPDTTEPGGVAAVDIEARDSAFAPVPDARVDATVTTPGGDPQPLAVHSTGAAGRFSAAVVTDRPGLYRVHAAARRGSTPLGSVDRWMLVGGAEREFSDPRLNEGYLRRVATASGGRYVRAPDAGRVVSWLRESVPTNAPTEHRDLWDQSSVFLLVVGLFSAEWTLRRRWGLR
jgi:hypothetical protein